MLSVVDVGAAAEQAAALEALRGAHARESSARSALASAVTLSGESLMTAREWEVPWRACQTALGGVSRAAANARLRDARTRTAAPGEAAPGSPVLSELTGRWGGQDRTLPELQALQVAAEAGAMEAGEAERAACEAEPGRRTYETADLVGRCREEAQEEGRLALVRACRRGEVPMLDAWPLVADEARRYRPLWRRGGSTGDGHAGG